MTAQEKARITEIAAQLRYASQELNYIKRAGSKHDLLQQAVIVREIADKILTAARS